jgi:hypothetical protein
MATRPGERPPSSGLGAPPAPQVNLLPPEVRSRRALGRIKIALAGFLIVVLVVVAGAYVYAGIEVRNADAKLDEASTRVQNLMSQQAEYADVPRVNAQIATITEARLFATSTEIEWARYWRAIEAVTPAGWSIQTLQTALPRPGEAAMPGTNPLGAANIGTITFVGRAKTVPDIAAWMDALEQIPGYVDAWFTNAQITEESGSVYYEVGATVQVETSAFWGRFVPEEPEAADDADDASDGDTGDAGTDESPSQESEGEDL